MHTFTYDIYDLMHNMIDYQIKFQFLQDQNKNDEKQEKQELERRSTLENRNWSDRSSRSTTTTPLVKYIPSKKKLFRITNLFTPG